MRRSTLAFAAFIASFGVAHAETRCGAETHSRYGETRAYFNDILSACRPDGSCSAVSTVADRSGATAYNALLRVARDAKGPWRVDVTGVTPMPKDAAAPMALAFARSTQNFPAPGRATSVNEFVLAQGAQADPVIAALKAAQNVRWDYESDGGPTSQTFPLRGLTAALAWVECMQSGGK